MRTFLTLALVSVLCLGTVACAKLRPDADAFLTRSEQALAVGVDTLDAFFTLEKTNQAEMEKVIPGCHATAENLRRKAPESIRAVTAALDAYRATKGAPEAKAKVEVYIATLQSLVAEVKPLLAKWGETKTPQAQVPKGGGR